MKFTGLRSAVAGLAVVSLLGWQTANAELLLLLEGDVASGGVAVDSSGKANHGIYLGSAGGTDAGKTGGGLNFNADESWMVLGSTPVGNSEIRAQGAANVAESMAGVNTNQAFTVGWWAAGGDTNPRNTSAFWAEGPTPNGGNRAFQAHTTWSNGQAYLDIGGCCDGGTQRINGVLEEDHIKASVGDEWSHIAFTYGPEDDDTWSRRMYVNGELYAWGGDGDDAEGITDVEPFEGENGWIPLLTKFAIAADQNGNNQWEGRMDDFFVTDNKLEAEDLAAVVADGARAYFGVTGTPEPVNAQFLVATNDSRGVYQPTAEVTNKVFSEEPVQAQGLTQYWYGGGGLAPDAPNANMRNADGIDQFVAAATDPNFDIEDYDYPEVAGGFVSGFWAGGQDTGVVPGRTLQRYPDEVVAAESQLDGDSGNYNNYGVRAFGEIFIPSDGEYVIRDGIDDLTMIAIDLEGDGDIDGLGDITFDDFGTLNGEPIDDVIVADDDWANANGSSNPEEFNGLATFSGIAEGGEWRKIELWMAEGGGGDAGIFYMGKTDDPDIFDWTLEGALTDDQRAAYAVPAENLRGEGIALVSADAGAALAPGTEFVIQVGADGTHDSIAVDNADGLYATTLDVSGVSLNVEAEEGVAPGTSITVFDADTIVGAESVSVSDGWTLSGGVLTFGDGPMCDPNSMGDLDGNGTVEFADFLTLSANFGQAVSSHSQGDIDCNGTVEFADFLTLSANFGQAVGGAESVPEPSGILLLSLAGLMGGMLRRRRS